MSFSRVTVSSFACLLILNVGCPSEPKDSGTPKQPAKPAAPAPPKAAPASAPAAKGEPSCLGAFAATGPEKVMEIAGKSYALNGDILTLKTADGDDEYVLGQLTDIKEDTPENMGNVKKLIEWMQTEKADALIVTGDLGESQPSIERVMRALATFKGPVFVMIGNREGKTDFENAFKAVTADLPNLFNMNKVRLFNADDVSVVSLPGYFNPAYIHSQDGCRYTSDDVSKLTEIIKLATSTVVLASHGPPRQESMTGIDRIHEGVNVGDPTLARYLSEKRVHFGVFGNIHEAGGKATDLSGKEEIRPETYVTDLFLNPGPTDAVRWPLLDGTESIGMGGYIKVKAKKAMYKIRRLRPGEAPPIKAEAAAPEENKAEEAKTPEAKTPEAKPAPEEKPKTP